MNPVSTSAHLMLFVARSVDELVRLKREDDSEWFIVVVRDASLTYIRRYVERSDRVLFQALEFSGVSAVSDGVVAGSVNLWNLRKFDDAA